MLRIDPCLKLQKGMRVSVPVPEHHTRGFDQVHTRCISKVGQV